LNAKIDGLDKSKKHLRETADALGYFEFMVSNSTDMIAIIDKHYKYIYANNAYMDAFNVTSETLTGSSVIDVIGEDLFNSSYKPDSERCLKNEKVKYRNWFEFPGIGRRYLEVTFFPYTDTDGAVIGSIYFGQNITEYKLSEDALKKSEALVNNKLRAILEPEGNLGTLELSDIVDIDILQSIMEDFYQITGMLGAVLDLSGKVLVAVGWQDICTKFHRCHPETLKNCIESDTILTNGVAEGEFKAYKCKNNLWDMVTPLMVGDKHVGNIFIGQFFYADEEPDIEIFRKQAQLYGFDETEYLAALERVPRLSKETLNVEIHLYAKIAKIISSLSYSKIKLSRMLAEQKRAENALKTQQEQLEIIVKERTQKLEEQKTDLEAMNRLFVGREFRIKELRDEIKKLKKDID